MMPLFTTFDDQRMAREIGEARFHVILAVPGVSEIVAQALIAASGRLSKGNVRVVLDVSAQVARLGFGEQAAVELLKAHGLDVLHHPGLRIGVLICDEHGWSFAVSPRLVEAAPGEASSAFNAIALTSAQVLVLRGELPQTSAQAPDGTDSAEKPLVGVAPVDGAILEPVRKALAIAPPQKFDLARQTQVYSALIQFVELKFEGFNIQSRRVQLPKSLPLIASSDREFKSRLTASLRVLDNLDKPTNLKRITDALEELRKAYLYPVGPAGRVMLKSERTDFETKLGQIEDDLKQCKEGLREELEETLEKVIAAITPELARAVMQDPPARFRGLFAATEDSAAEYVREKLTKAFPKADELVEKMTIHRFYKDVTYETLKDAHFKERVLGIIPQPVLDGSLLVERVAAESGEGSM